jgi:maltose alpha-D-glucosyltransferase/alpha-amylase
MSRRWYRNAAFYSVDVGLFQDSNGDGVGDFQGLITRLDYLDRLGITALWLNPIHPSPRRDGGYDITDHYDVDPRFGSLGDFAQLLDEADERGLRVIMDLVVNHTSDQHPWFQEARADRRSRYRDWYVWSDEEPRDGGEGPVFPGVEQGIWSYDDEAGAWYRHRFYSFEPDLDTTNPAVREEILRIAQFWLRLGVSGFRIDAAPFLIEPRRPEPDRTAVDDARSGDPRAEEARAEEGRPSEALADGGTVTLTAGRHQDPLARPRLDGPDFAFLHELNELVSWRGTGAVLLAEANVPDREVVEYFGSADGASHRVTMVFAFRLNQSIMLALAREEAEPIVRTLEELPELPRYAQWATFLRNHDEVDLGRLTDAERAEVFAAFGPEPDVQLYGRGIRRRLAPMLDGVERRLRMAYSLQLSMPGTPVIRYGDEIGMGEDLRLPEREAIRTPMQWDDTVNAGFSEAGPQGLIAPVVDDDGWSYRRINVLAQRADADSTLTWFDRMLHTLRECPEVGRGHHRVLPTGDPHVLVHVAEDRDAAVLFVHNLSREPRTVSIDPPDGARPVILAADGDCGVHVDLTDLKLDGYGYRWVRLDRLP